MSLAPQLAMFHIRASAEGLTPLFPEPGSLWDLHNWTWDISITFPLVILSVWYGIGLIQRRQLAQLVWRHVAFYVGWIFLLLALVSPLHRLGDALFSAHMLQHEILILLAAPLLSVSHPSVTFIYAFPMRVRRQIGVSVSHLMRVHLMKIATSAISAFLLHALALWMWHVPFLYEATLRSELIHAVQHLSFFLSALLFWSSLYGAGRSGMSYGAGVFYVFGTAIHCGALGALLTFSSVLWYPIYADRTEIWNLSPLQDQQLGGLIMWVPSGVVFLVIGVWMFAQWLTVSEQRLGHTTLGEGVPPGRETV